MPQWRAGQYRAWDCLNQTYVVTDTLFADEKPRSNRTAAYLKGILRHQNGRHAVRNASRSTGLDDGL